MSSAGYKSIPDVDVERGGDLEDRAAGDATITQRAMERYPQATEPEATFLGKLDYAMDRIKPEIVLPKIPAENVGQPTSMMEFLQSLYLPTSALIATLLSAVVAILMKMPIIQKVYPYFACIFMFASSIPAIRTRVLTRATPVFDIVNNTKQTVENKSSGVSTRAIFVLEDAEKAMNRALEPIKVKAGLATRAEAMLRTFGSDVDIPDPSDVEKAFSGLKDQLQRGFDHVDITMHDLDDKIPRVLKSPSDFERFALYPFLAVLLVLQLVAVYYSTTLDALVAKSLFGGVDSAPPTVLVEGTLSLDATTHDADLVSNSTNHASSNGGSNQQDWIMILFAIQSYLATVIEIVIAFGLSQAKAIAFMINRFLASIERQVNTRLDEYLGDVYRSVFQTGLNRVKEKMLTLQAKMQQLEGPLRRVQDNLPAGASLAQSIAGFFRK